VHGGQTLMHRRSLETSERSDLHSLLVSTSPAEWILEFCYVFVLIVEYMIVRTVKKLGYCTKIDSYPISFNVHGCPYRGRQKEENMM